MSSEVVLTERLILEPWNESRRDDFADLTGSPEVMRFVGKGEPWSEDHARTVFDHQLEHWTRHGFGWYSVIETASDKWFGMVGLSEIREGISATAHTGAIEVSWWLRPEAWGQGYATETAVAIVADGFDRAKLDTIVGQHAPDNVVSGRIMAKLGMTLREEAVNRHGRKVCVLAIERTNDDSQTG